TESSGEHMNYPAPPVHPSGARPPRIDAKFVPRHVAIVMDGNGRWANQRGLPRTEGHRAGEASLLDVIHGAIEAGVDYLSAYAFSGGSPAMSSAVAGRSSTPSGCASCGPAVGAVCGGRSSMSSRPRPR